jgi:ADP-ribose pyrophosphatase
MEFLAQAQRGTGSAGRQAIWIESAWRADSQMAGVPVLLLDPEQRSVLLTRTLRLPVLALAADGPDMADRLKEATGYAPVLLRSLHRLDVDGGKPGDDLQVLLAVCAGPAARTVDGFLALDIDQAALLADAGALGDDDAASLVRHAQRNLFPPRPLMILVAGPYRSGTGDDPARLAANVAAMEACVMPLYEAGHLPVLGEWLALPTARLAGSTRHGDAVHDAVCHPHAQRMLARCDAVLRIGGASAGADLMVDTARRLGKRVFGALYDVPGVRHTRLVEHTLAPA